MLAPLKSMTIDLLRMFYFVALLIANQAGRERRRPYTAEMCSGLLFVLPYLESHKCKI